MNKCPYRSERWYCTHPNQLNTITGERTDCNGTDNCHTYNNEIRNKCSTRGCTNFSSNCDICAVCNMNKSIINDLKRRRKVDAKYINEYKITLKKVRDELLKNRLYRLSDEHLYDIICDSIGTE